MHNMYNMFTAVPDYVESSKSLMDDNNNYSKLSLHIDDTNNF